MDLEMWTANSCYLTGLKCFQAHLFLYQDPGELVSNTSTDLKNCQALKLPPSIKRFKRMQRSISWMTFFFSQLLQHCPLYHGAISLHLPLLLFDFRDKDKRVSLCPLTYSCPLTPLLSLVLTQLKQISLFPH